MRRPVVFVLLAGFAALVAALVVYSALHKRELEVQQATLKSEDVVVAAHDLPVGSKIDASAVKLVRWSRESIPPGAFTDAAAPLNRFTRTDFVQNEPLVADRLFDGDKNAGVLPLLIPKGMRAMSVAVDEVSDIAGFVMPHAHVDVLVSMTSGGAAGNQAFSKIVLQNVEVLAVAQQVENSGADKPEIARVVTLLVDPNDAERLALASHEGALRLAMRNYTDQKIIATRGVDVAQMLRPDGSARAGGIGDAGEKPVQIQIMRDGKSVENVDFVRGEGGAMKARSAKSLAAANAGPVLEPPAKMSGIDAAPASGLAAAAPAAAVDADADSAGGDAHPGVSKSVSGAAVADAGDHAANIETAASDRGLGAPHARTIDVP